MFLTEMSQAGSLLGQGAGWWGWWGGWHRAEGTEGCLPSPLLWRFPRWVFLPPDKHGCSGWSLLGGLSGEHLYRLPTRIPAPVGTWGWRWKGLG